jgi:DNA-binding HxlR family transcriptional regulator
MLSVKQSSINEDHNNWDFFGHFVLRSTGFPYEWMKELKMQQTFDLIFQNAKWEQVESKFNQELSIKREQLKAYFDSEDFRQAVFISNPDMYQHIDRYMKHFQSHSRPSKVKRIEKKLFTYLQRFCGKNESASFFGPLNYGQVEPNIDEYWDGSFIETKNLQKREAFLSYWAVKALAKAVAKENELAPYVPLQIPSWIVVRKEYVVLSSGKRINLPAWMMEIMHYIQETSSCLWKLQNHFNHIEAGQLKASLEKLISKGLIHREWIIPSTVVHPLHRLLEQLRELPDSLAKNKWCQALDELASEVTKLANLPIVEKRRSFAHLEETFTKLTGEPSRRGKASLYADRFIYYEDAQGHIQEFRFGKPFIEDLQTKLAGSLNMSAAYGEEIWAYYQELGRNVYEDMQVEARNDEKRQLANSGIPFSSFINKLRQTYSDVPQLPKSSFSNKIEAIIREKGTEQRVVKLTSDQLNVFPSNRSFYSLPDLFLQAENIEALRNGDVQIILAKLHHHLLMHNWMTYFYQDKERLERDLVQLVQKLDHEDGTVLSGLEIMRRNKAYYDYPTTVIEYAEKPDSSKESIKLTDLIVVRNDDGHLELQEKNTSRPIELYVPLADQVHYLPFAMFSKPMLLHVPISSGKHTPRIVIDDVVYQRERWFFYTKQLVDLFHQLQGPLLLKKVEEWRQAEGIPEVVYIKGSDVRKPYWVDFKNYFSLELMQQILLENNEITIEEMLPDPHHLWLKSRKGSHSCELRMSVYKLGIKEVSEHA